MRTKKDIYLEDEVAKQDLLGYKPYVSAISQAILKDEVTTPFTIGIYGQWGSGKSSLMNLIREKIDSEDKQTIFSMWFAPWQYQSQTNLLAPLFLTLLEEAKKSKALKPRFDQLNKEIKKIFNVTAEILLELLAKPFIINVGKIKETGEKYEKEQDLLRNTDFENILFLHKLKTNFEELIESLVDKDGKLVIFVDDLDRCRPEKVIEMLESIKLFIGVKRCIFIIGMNYDIISLCIRNKYKDYSLTSSKLTNIDIDEYLEKIIQLPFRIPALHDKNVKDFIENVEKDSEIKKLKDFFAKFLPKNPRKVKKVLNVFRLMIKLAKYSGRMSASKKSGIKLELLAKIIVIRERWLDLYVLFEDNPTLLINYEKKPDDIPTAVKTRILRNREDLIGIFKYGTVRFEGQKDDLQQYFSLSETTKALEREEREIVTTQGVMNPPDSGLQSEKVKLSSTKENSGSSK